jgi:hypothetical protein
MKNLCYVVAALALSGTARAQTNPTFTFSKPDEAKVDASKPPPPAVEWKAQIKGGLLVTSGNSQTTNGSIGVNASRKQGNNRLALDGGAAYGHSSVVVPVYDSPTSTQIDALTRTEITTTNNWLARGRYDRFFTPNNSGYASAQIASDKIAGKALFGGGQVGYSRQIYKSAMHTFVGEAGYDFSYESYIQPPPPSAARDSVAIHSARLFLGETLKMSPETGLSASVEAFLNLNREGKALNAGTGVPGVDAFHDTRVIGKLGLTTTLMKRLSIGFGLTLRYDQNPAPLPIPATAMAGATFAPGFVPFAEKVDTQTEVNLIYTFL